MFLWCELLEIEALGVRLNPGLSQGGGMAAAVRDAHVGEG
jgi:hypothetical protein